MSSRRSLLCGVAALTVVPAGAGTLAAIAHRPQEDLDVATVLAGIVPRLASAAAVGRRIWQRDLVRPDEVAAFAQTLLSAARREPAGAAGHVAAARRLDFARGETLVVDGWVVARTEARLCALAAVGARA